VRVTPQADYQSAAFNHSATPVVPLHVSYMEVSGYPQGTSGRSSARAGNRQGPPRGVIFDLPF
jgi:hypothetical protein